MLQQSCVGGVDLEKDLINEEQVERDLAMLGNIRSLAWQRSPANLLALIDRLRVKLMVEDISRRQRHVYRAVIDYFEDVLEERFKQEKNADPKNVRRSARAYVRDILKSFDD